jgi:hypothetical protein
VLRVSKCAGQLTYLLLEAAGTFKRKTSVAEKKKGQQGYDPKPQQVDRKHWLGVVI